MNVCLPEHTADLVRRLVDAGYGDAQEVVTLAVLSLLATHGEGGAGGNLHDEFEEGPDLAALVREALDDGPDVTTVDLNRTLAGVLGELAGAGVPE